MHNSIKLNTVSAIVTKILKDSFDTEQINKLKLKTSNHVQKAPSIFYAPFLVNREHDTIMDRIRALSWEKENNSRKVELKDGIIIENKKDKVKDNNIPGYELMALVTESKGQFSYICKDNFNSHKWWSYSDLEVKRFEKSKALELSHGISTLLYLKKDKKSLWKPKRPNLIPTKNNKNMKPKKPTKHKVTIMTKEAIRFIILSHICRRDERYHPQTT